jgi:hypothetical protein
VTSDKSAEKRALFGWCMTGHHKNCIVEFPEHRCACACHKMKEEKSE